MCACVQLHVKTQVLISGAVDLVETGLLSLESADLARLASRVSPLPTGFVTSLALGFQVSHHTWLFDVNAGDQAQVLMLTQQAFYQPSYLPRP